MTESAKTFEKLNPKGCAEVRADERLKVISEISIELEKYHKDICMANYPFNFIDMALDKVKRRANENNV